MEYEDQILSDKVDLVYPPILDDSNSNNITFYNETGLFKKKFFCWSKWRENSKSFFFWK